MWVMNLRLLTPSDVDAASSIIGRNYSARWRRTAALEIASMFSDSAISPVYWVAEDDGQIVGIAGHVQSWMDYGIYQIFWVNVLPERQRQGIGRALVNKVISAIRRNPGAFLVQLSASALNVDYYERHFGFLRAATLGPDRYALMFLPLRRVSLTANFTKSVHGRPERTAAHSRRPNAN